MNGPTKLTFLRILLIPLIIVFNELGSPWDSWVSLAVFLVASITDWLDGYLARKHNLVTTFGKLLDPLADKLLVLTAYLVILVHHYLATWIVILMIGREMAITGLRTFLAAEGIVLEGSKMGKWKTTFQIISLSFLFVSGALPFADHIGTVTAYLALILSLLSAYHYVAHFWNLLGEKIMKEQLSQDSINQNEH